MRVIPSLIMAEVRPVMEASAQELVDLMKTLVPVEDGNLRDSIGWAWGNAPKGSIALDSIEARKNAENRIVIFAGNELAYYARFVEFGTSPHSVSERADLSASAKSGSEQDGIMHPGSAAHPFFWPAYRALKAKIRRRITAAVRSGIKKANQ
ncbi:MAG: HK97 gp10 family phage protein [Sphingomonadales bacterium]|nr:HK97 gp10 family phage protein [Sphingomonadales bacterium]